MKPLASLTNEEIMEELARRWHDNLAKIATLNSQIRALTQTRDIFINEMQLTNKAFMRIREDHPSIKLPKLQLPSEFQFAINPDLTLGDAMEILIKERGALTQRELIDAIQAGGLSISAKNPHVVIANAVSRDSKKRFVRLANGKVSLAKR